MNRPYEEICPRCLPAGYTPSPQADALIAEVDAICANALGGLEMGGLRSSQLIGLIVAMDRRGMIPLLIPEEVTFE